MLYLAAGDTFGSSGPTQATTEPHPGPEQPRSPPSPVPRQGPPPPPGGGRASLDEVPPSRARPAFLTPLQRDTPALPPPPPPALRRGLPPRNDRPIHHLERGHRHGHGSRLSAASEI